MSLHDKLHLVERAAERLIRSGGAPSGLGALAPDTAPPPVDPALPPLAAPLPAASPPAEEAAYAPLPAVPLPPSGVFSPPGDPPATPVARPAGHPEVVRTRMLDLAQLVAAGLAEGGGGRSRIAEEFRLVQNQILRVAFGADRDVGFANLIMVTSARPNEGKTFTALNLAVSIARRADHRVLLVDADAKHGSLTDLLRLSDQPGLLEVASASSVDVGDSLVGTPIAGLTILPVGRQRGHRGDMFASNNMTRVIQDLGRRYTDRLVVLDVAPCLSTSDPAALATSVGQILFVVEAEHTQRDEVEAALDLIQTCPTITLLLNKVQMTTSHSFGAYSYSYSS